MAPDFKWWTHLWRNLKPPCTSGIHSHKKSAISSYPMLLRRIPQPSGLASLKILRVAAEGRSQEVPLLKARLKPCNLNIQIWLTNIQRKMKGLVMLFGQQKRITNTLVKRISSIHMKVRFRCLFFIFLVQHSDIIVTPLCLIASSKANECCPVQFSMINRATLCMLTQK